MILVKNFKHIKIVKFEAAHLSYLDFNQDAFESLMRVNTPLYDHADIIERYSYAYTGLSGGKVLGCAGIIPIWNGVGDFWMYLGKETFKDKILTIRIMQELLDDIITNNHLHRVQAVVKTDFCAGHRFAKFFGFEFEGHKRHYGPDKEDFTQYAKVIS
jgi:RimJ/RimL family protein N-acetyltransferase